MPTRAPRTCLESGCLATTTRPSGRCESHERARTVNYERQRGSAAKRGYVGTWWREQRQRVLARHPVCQWGSLPSDRVFFQHCREASTDAAHIVPRAQGGDDSLNNLRGLCHQHHSAETSKRESWNSSRERSKS